MKSNIVSLNGDENLYTFCSRNEPGQLSKYFKEEEKEEDVIVVDVVSVEDKPKRKRKRSK